MKKKRRHHVRKKPKTKKKGGGLWSFMKEIAKDTIAPYQQSNKYIQNLEYLATHPMALNAGVSLLGDKARGLGYGTAFSIVAPALKQGLAEDFRDHHNDVLQEIARDVPYD